MRAGVGAGVLAALDEQVATYVGLHGRGRNGGACQGGVCAGLDLDRPAGRHMGVLLNSVVPIGFASGLVGRGREGDAGGGAKADGDADACAAGLVLAIEGGLNRPRF